MEDTMKNKSTSTWVHPFERAGLGKAPFSCVGMFEKLWQPAPGEPYRPAGSCQFCGTCIRYCFRIKSSDSREFIVGCDCLDKTGDTALSAQARAEEQRAKREDRRAEADARRAEQERWLETEEGQMDLARRDGARLGAEFALRETNYDQAQAKYCAKWVGQIGQRLTLSLHVERKIPLAPTHPGRFKGSVLHLMSDDRGNRFVWFCSGLSLPEGGVTVMATVKDHSTRDGLRQTVLTRVTDIANKDLKTEARKLGRDLARATQADQVDEKAFLAAFYPTAQGYYDSSKIDVDVRREYERAWFRELRCGR